MAQQSGSWERKPVRAFLIRIAAFALPLIFAILVAWQLTKLLPTPGTWPGMIFWWLLVMASSTMALRFADRFAKRLMPLAVLMKLSLVFPDKAPNRFGVSLKSGSAHSLEDLLERAERAGRHDDLTEAAETILALGAALNAHDPRTRGHGDRVRAYADMLGEEMGYTDEERNKLKWAAMLHDIGKLRVPSEVINSPGKLSDEEWVIMRNHPDWGMELAAPLLPWLGEFAAAIGQHHERFDGNGYPNGIVGEDIGLAARITSVADTYDVMTSVRSYKEARPASEAREELARCAGSQFDPVVVRAFLNISLGRQRWVAGPLSWLAQVPFFQSALQGATTLAQNAAVAAQTGMAATVIGATAVVAPAIIDTPDLEPAIALPAIVVEANDDSLTLPEDGSDVVFLLGNDDVEVSSLTIVSGPSHGTATLGAGGTLTYIPDPEFSGTDTLTYEVCGPDGMCDAAVLAISVTAVNDSPDLMAVPASLDEDTSTVIDVLAAVVDIDGNPAAATVTLVGVADEGLILSNGDGTFTYTPPPDFFGTDSFTVQVCDEGGACELRSLSISVTALNDSPTVEVVVPPITEDIPASIFVDAADADGDLLTTSIIAGPTSGAAVIDIDGSMAYTPAPDFFGAESITLEVCDQITCVTAVVDFTVAGVNDPPIAPGPGPLVTAEETMISFDPLAGASDPEGGAVSLDSFDAVSANGGTIALGSLEYTPATDFVGVDTFDYTIGDPDGGTATVAVSVSVTVTGENDDPVAVDDGYVATEDTPLVVAAPGVLSNDTDVDGDPLTAALGTSPASGTVVLSVDGSFTYTPTGDFAGPDGFTYLTDDGAGSTASAAVSIEVLPANDAPKAFDDIASTSGPGAVVVAVLANDVDVEGDFDPASVTIVVPPTKGSAVAKPDGTIDYTPDSGETGSDSFVYEICDLSALCDIATVTMGLKGPDAVDDTATVSEDGSVTILATANDTDPDADLDPTSAVVHIAPTNGTAIANGDGSFDYSPDLNYAGGDSFEYKVCDLLAACDAATVTITVTAVNDAPVVRPPATAPDSASVLEDGGPVNVDVLLNDTDPNLDPPSLSIDTAPANGTAVVVAGPTIDYGPDPNYFGSDSFVYEICDTSAACSTETVSVTVTTVNDVPSFVVGPDQVVLEDAGGHTVDPHPTLISAGPANESDQSTSFNVSNDNPALFKNAPTIDDDGNLKYEAWDDVSGSATVTVSITDDGGTADGGVDTSPDQTFTITVTGVNDRPDFDDGPDVTVDEDSGPHTFAGWATAITAGASEEEPPTQTLTFEISANDNVPLFAVAPSVDSATGDLTFTLTPDANGAANIQIRLKDDGGTADGGQDTSPVQPFKITVDPVNDDPVAADDNYPLAVIEGGSFTAVAGVDRVAANDTDVEDGTPPGGNATLVTPPAYHSGVFTLNADGSFTYAHDGSENFSDTFTYTVDDSESGTSNVATATITITPVNEAPVATDDDGVGTFWEPFFHVPAGNPPTLIPAAAFIDGDSDPDGDPLTIVVASGPTTGGGFVSCDPTGCTYTAPAAAGADTFTYQVDDGTLISAPATVTIDVENASAGLILAAISAAPDPVAPGGTVTFVTEVFNAGIDATGGVVLRADYPTGAAFFSASSTKGACVDLGSRVECSIGFMAAKDLETVTIDLTIVSGPGPLSFTPWVTTDNSGDANPLSNYATHVVGII